MRKGVNSGARLSGLGLGSLLVQDHFGGLDIDGWWLLTAVVLLVLALLLLLATWPPFTARGRRTLGLAPEKDLHATFEIVGNAHWLQVGLRNDGFTLRDAAMNVLVPSRARFIHRVHNNGHRVDEGVEADTPEELEPGEPSIYWNETGLQVPGGGNSTLFWFMVSHDPGTYPVRLKLYDDSGEKARRIEVDGKFTIPPLQVEPERRRQTVEGIYRDLDFDRQQVLALLATDLYEASDMPWLRLRNQAQLRTGLSWNGEDAGLIAELVDTFDELGRLDEIRVQLGGESPRLRDDHRAERTLAHVLHTLVRLRLNEGISA